MPSFYANVLNETEKIWKRRRTKAFLLLTLLLPAAAAALPAWLQSGTGAALGLGNDLPMRMLNVFTFALLPLFLFMTAADSFSGEIASRTLKLVLVRPITRAKAFASKVSAVAIFLAVLLASLWIVSTAAGWVAGGAITGGFTDSLKAYAASFVPMAAIGLFAVFIAQWFGNVSGAMAATIVIYAAAKLLPFLFPAVSSWSVFSYTNWYVLWAGNGASPGKLLNTFVLLLSYSIMAYAGGWILFEKKQL
jgi:ABC-2 type transport system permease protein